jgi:MATE family multidrug resistance protein
VAINMASLTYMAATGIASAGGINVGTALGERSRKEIFLAGNVALVLVMLFMSLCAGIMYFGRNHLVLAYTQSAAVIEIAVPLIVWGAIFQLFDGIQAVSLGLLRGLQDVRFPTIITIASYWGLGLPLCYYLGFTQNWGAEGIWIALTISLIFSAIFLSWRFYSRAASIDMESLKLED